MTAPIEETRTSPAHDDATLHAMAELERRREAGEPILPVKVTRHYRRLVEEEVAGLGRTGGPLHSVVYPRPDRFDPACRGQVDQFDFGCNLRAGGCQGADARTIFGKLEFGIAGINFDQQFAARDFFAIADW